MGDRFRQVRARLDYRIPFVSSDPVTIRADQIELGDLSLEFGSTPHVAEDLRHGYERTDKKHPLQPWRGL